MSSLLLISLLGLWGAVGADAPPGAGGRAARPAPPDNPDGVAQLGGAGLVLQKDADGNVSSVTYGFLKPLTEDRLLRLERLGHVRTLYLWAEDGATYVRLLRAWRTLRKVTLTGLDASAEVMDALSALPELETIELFSAKLHDSAMKHLTGPPGLRRLDLTSSTITDAGLASVGRLAGLRALDLSHCRVSDAGLPALAGLAELETLVLNDTDVEGAGLGALKGLWRLRELDLRATGVPAYSAAGLWAIEGLKILGLRSKDDMLRADDPKCYQALRAWNFRPSRNDLGNVDGLGVAGPGRGVGDWAAQLNGLRSLRLLDVGPRASEAEVAHIADAPSIEILFIDGCQITDRALAGLARLPRLRRLGLTRCRALTDGVLAHLGNAAALEFLDLSDTPINGAGLRHLATAKKLALLALCGTAVDDGAMAHVRAIEGLEWLSLAHTIVTDAGLLRLRGMAKLRSVDIRDTHVTPAAYLELVNQTPSMLPPRASPRGLRLGVPKEGGAR
jgi:hypothetical protein